MHQHQSDPPLLYAIAADVSVVTLAGRADGCLSRAAPCVCVILSLCVHRI